MRVAVLLLLCIAAGSQASFLDDLKNAFHNIGTSLTTTFHAVGDQAKVVGQNLLTTASEQGKQLASQALQSEQCASANNNNSALLSFTSMGVGFETGCFASIGVYCRFIAVFLHNFQQNIQTLLIERK